MTNENKTKNNNATSALAPRLFKMADELRKNIDAAEYKHVVLGLIFLRYISDAFEKRHKQITDGEGEFKNADPEDEDAYRMDNIFFVPKKARWSEIQGHAKQTDIGEVIDAAMRALENKNRALRGILPQVYAKPNLDKTTLGKLIDIISNAEKDIAAAAAQSQDLLGYVYEYFLGEFALAEGKKGGQFYTPQSIVKLLIEMLRPRKGRVFDPACGSGGMFVQSDKFVQSRQGRRDDISIFGQESNQTTWKLCRMNLAIRGINGENVKWNADGSFHKDEHRDLKMDFVIANPPFNDSGWGGEALQGDDRWRYGKPPVGNANFAWVQHFIYHLKPGGVAGFVLAKGSLTSKTVGEYEIRKNIIEKRLVDCIVNLPAKLFLNTQIPASLWFLSKKDNGHNGDRARKDQILFIDARELGHLINRRTRQFADADIHKIADAYHQWRADSDKYADIPGFCKAAPIQQVRDFDYVLAPGRYVGAPEPAADIDFAARFAELKNQFEDQVKQEGELNRRIAANLKRVQIEPMRKEDIV